MSRTTLLFQKSSDVFVAVALALALSAYCLSSLAALSLYSLLGSLFASEAVSKSLEKSLGRGEDTSLLGFLLLHCFLLSNLLRKLLLANDLLASRLAKGLLANDLLASTNGSLLGHFVYATL